MALKTLWMLLRVLKKWHNWKDNKSQIKTNRVLLKDVVALRAERGKCNIYYKTDITNNFYQELDFLNKSHLKKTPLPPSKTTPCGIHENKREEHIDRLKQVLPDNRKTFWKNLPVNFT
ncbi:unnamed protein product [Macrosiphum euphorbiae]|uniref:Uncharacterized protein n=1 Tax=Macrosiphum euphorbiae TaxID=13131 RepID=A0AAV0Y7Q4_9HEMI|nr:unnamed protein product [Macrosiphum euphorbiae]